MNMLRVPHMKEIKLTKIKNKNENSFKEKLILYNSSTNIPNV